MAIKTGGGEKLIEVVIIKNKGSDKRDLRIFTMVVDAAKFALSKFGPAEVMMFRRKHNGKGTNILILITQKDIISQEEEPEIIKQFNSRIDINVTIRALRIFKDGASFYEKF